MKLRVDSELPRARTLRIAERASYPCAALAAIRSTDAPLLEKAPLHDDLRLIVGGVRALVVCSEYDSKAVHEIRRQNVLVGNLDPIVVVEQICGEIGSANLQFRCFAICRCEARTSTQCDAIGSPASQAGPETGHAERRQRIRLENS